MFDTDDAGLPASTEPRPFGRGEEVELAIAAKGEALQRSPGPLAGESSALPRGQHPRVAASTEPRPFGRGEYEDAHEPGFSFWLQRSPGPLAGERIPREVISTVRFMGFNGAPALWPGRARAGDPRGRIDAWLQRSPGPLAGESLAQSRLSNGHLPWLQRSPGPLAGERPQPGLGSQREGRRFNGAPALWPGRGAHAITPGTLSTTLQRSPGPLAGERKPQERSSRSSYQLQRSPGPLAGERRPLGCSARAAGPWLQRSPGPLAGESDPLPVHIPLRCRASTEPRPFGRGESPRSVVCNSTLWGFNGAPALWPGRVWAERSKAILKGGFNGAPALWPGRAQPKLSTLSL